MAGQGMNTLKVVFIGESNSGKTQLISTYLHGMPPDSRKSTLFENYFKDVEYKDSTFRLYICDTGGDADMNRLKRMSYLNTDVFVVCVDHSKQDSLNKTEKWMKDLHETGKPIILCLTKLDCERKLKTEAFERFIDQFRIDGLYETSSYNRKSIKVLFENIIKIALENTSHEEEPYCSSWFCCR